MSSTIDTIPIPSMPDLGAVTDASALVAEKSVSGRFLAPAIAAYVQSKLPSVSTLPPLGAVADSSLFVGQSPASGTFTAVQVANYVSAKVTATGARVSVRNYGAKGDGVTDDTAAFNACVAAAVAGGEMYIPVGTYRISGSIAINKNLTVNGDGRLSSTILVASASAHAFVVTGAVDIYDLGFTPAAGVTRTGGAYVAFGGGPGRCRMDRFWMASPFYGVWITSAALADIEIMNGEILTWSASGAGIRIDNGLAIQISHCFLQQGAPPGAGYGIYITNSGDVDIVACQITGAGNCLFANIGAGSNASSIWATETYFDSGTCGVQFLASGGNIARCKFVGCWMGGHTSQGIRMSTSGGGSIGGMDFIGCHIFGNASDGVTVFDSGCWDFQFNGCEIAGNSGEGINMNTPHPWRVQNCRIGGSFGFGNNTASAINIGAGSDGFIIMGNDLRNNNSAAIAGPGLNAGSNYLIKDNLGWVTYNYGNSSVATGTLSATIAHGLSGNPVVGAFQIVITPTSGQLAGNQLYISATTGSTFTVSMTSTAGAPITFSWLVHQYGAI